MPAGNHSRSTVSTTPRGWGAAANPLAGQSGVSWTCVSEQTLTPTLSTEGEGVDWDSTWGTRYPHPVPLPEGEGMCPRAGAQRSSTRSLPPFFRTHAFGFGGAAGSGLFGAASANAFDAARPLGNTTSGTDCGAASSTHLSGRRFDFTSNLSFW